MAKPRIVQTKKTFLKAPISNTETGEILLERLQDLSGNNLEMSDFGDKGYITINPGNDNEEIVSFTGFTVNDDDTVSIDTSITRGLESKHPYGAGGTAHQHGAGDVVVVSNNPQVLDDIITYLEGVANDGAADASHIQKGLVEIATDAEIEADTENGSTGAALVVPADATILPTSDEKDALAGNSGTPSSSNTFVTEDGRGAASVNVEVFEADGTWNKPSNLLYAVIEAVGGGEDGGSISSTGGTAPGGDGGDYVRKEIAEGDLGSSETVTVGEGGTSPEESSFGSHVNTDGTGADIHIPGQPGGEGIHDDTDELGFGGPGGDSKLGNGGPQRAHSGGGGTGSTNGAPGSGYGAGGSGCARDGSGDCTGGSGTDGVVIVTEYLN